MEVRKLFCMWIFFLFSSAIQSFDWVQFYEISNSYFQARHIKLITVVNCFYAEDNFQLMKKYLEAGFTVHLLNDFDNFNVSWNGNSGVAVDGSCEDKLRTLLRISYLNEFMQTHIFWMFLIDAQESADDKPSFVEEIKTRYNGDLRHVEVLPGSNAVVGILQSSWMIFDVHKKHSKGDLVFIEVCYRGRDLANLTNMHHALRRFDRNSKERKNLRGYAMPTGVAVSMSSIILPHQPSQKKLGFATDHRSRNPHWDQRHFGYHPRSVCQS